MLHGIICLVRRNPPGCRLTAPRPDRCIRPPPGRVGGEGPSRNPGSPRRAGRHRRARARPRGRRALRPPHAPPPKRRTRPRDARESATKTTAELRSSVSHCPSPSCAHRAPSALADLAPETLPPRTLLERQDVLSQLSSMRDGRDAAYAAAREAGATPPVYVRLPLPAPSLCLSVVRLTSGPTTQLRKLAGVSLGADGPFAYEHGPPCLAPAQRARKGG
jgi:hypothetical protein